MIEPDKLIRMLNRGMTHQEIADELGKKRQSITRKVKEYEGKGLIEKKWRTLNI